eukprot:TRINITY_DN3625_c0_g2_i1.p1 TRINITY_DN3625_c0_g2~~TRINITY_DN3625_c0_g2_i1.p1  ORF type:complete len:351 (-),score=105.25 TRINITY_DN3625_c0_g2_i1:173-1225(-)
MSEDEDPLGSSLWWVGAIIYTFGSIIINLGSNLIRLNHETLSRIPVDQHPPLYKRWAWLVGFTIFAIGNVLNFVGFMFTAQSLCAALGSVQFVTNLVFATLINKETATVRDFLATGFIMAGNVVIVIFGSKDSKTNTISDLYDLLIRPQFLVYLIVIAILVVVLEAGYWFAMWRISRTGETHAPELLLRFVPFAYAMVSAVIGTNSVILGKASAGLAKEALAGNGELDNIWTWIIVAGFVVITIFWLYRMNTALRLYDALFIIPLLQVIWLLFGVLGGGIFYDEFSGLTTLQLGMFCGGVITLICGVSLLSPRAKNAGDDEEEEDLEYDPVLEKKRQRRSVIVDAGEKHM